jgi:hypothetical protein
VQEGKWAVWNSGDTVPHNNVSMAIETKEAVRLHRDQYESGGRYVNEIGRRGRRSSGWGRKREKLRN